MPPTRPPRPSSPALPLEFRCALQNPRSTSLRRIAEPPAFHADSSRPSRLPGPQSRLNFSRPRQESTSRVSRVSPAPSISSEMSDDSITETATPLTISAARAQAVQIQPRSGSSGANSATMSSSVQNPEYVGLNALPTYPPLISRFSPSSSSGAETVVQTSAAAAASKERRSTFGFQPMRRASKRSTRRESKASAVTTPVHGQQSKGRTMMKKIGGLFTSVTDAAYIAHRQSVLQQPRFIDSLPTHESNMVHARQLIALAVDEPYERRREAMFACAQGMADGLSNVREAQIAAEIAERAAADVRMSLNMMRAIQANLDRMAMGLIAASTSGEPPGPIGGGHTSAPTSGGHTPGQPGGGHGPTSTSGGHARAQPSGYTPASSRGGHTRAQTSGGNTPASPIGYTTASSSGGHTRAQTSGGINPASPIGYTTASSSGGHPRVSTSSGHAPASSSGGHIRVSTSGGPTPASASIYHPASPSSYTPASSSGGHHRVSTSSGPAPSSTGGHGHARVSTGSGHTRSLTGGGQTRTSSGGGGHGRPSTSSGHHR